LTSSANQRAKFGDGTPAVFVSEGVTGRILEQGPNHTVSSLFQEVTKYCQSA